MQSPAANRIPAIFQAIDPFSLQHKEAMLHDMGFHKWQESTRDYN